MFAARNLLRRVVCGLGATREAPRNIGSGDLSEWIRTAGQHQTGTLAQAQSSMQASPFACESPAFALKGDAAIDQAVVPLRGINDLSHETRSDLPKLQAVDESTPKIRKLLGLDDPFDDGILLCVLPLRPGVYGIYANSTLLATHTDPAAADAHFHRLTHKQAQM